MVGPEKVLGVEGQGRDGWYTLGLALLSAAALWSWSSRMASRQYMYGVMLTGGLALALTAYNVQETAGFPGDIVSVGWGLILALIGSVLLLACAIRLAMLSSA